MYPDNEGLQVVPHSTLEHDANGLGCQKVPGHDAPELAPDRSNAPECYNAAVSEHINATAPEHINTDDNETTPPASELKADHQQQVQSKRFCGLSKRRVIIIGAVIAAIVIAVAVALGVVLGRKSSAPSDPSPSPSSSVAAFLPSFNGLALTKVKTSNGNSTIGYYQDVYGNIRERRALNTTWQYADNDIVVANAAVNGSTPVAATTYSTGDTLYKLVFFINGANQLMVTNKTTGDWTTPYTILNDDTVYESVSVGLEAVTYTSRSTQHVRVYYASAQGNIREIVMGDEPTRWNGQSNTPVGDRSGGLSGVGAIAQALGSYWEWSIYVRSRDTRLMQQWSAHTQDNGTILWSNDNNGRGYPEVGAGSAIVSCCDESPLRRVVFYQMTDGTLALIPVFSPHIPKLIPSRFQVGTVFKATYNDGTLASNVTGPLLYYRAANDTGLSYLQISDDRSQVIDGKVTG